MMTDRLRTISGALWIFSGPLKSSEIQRGADFLKFSGNADFSEFSPHDFQRR
jgi:hypothetical protein